MTNVRPLLAAAVTLALTTACSSDPPATTPPGVDAGKEAGAALDLTIETYNVAYAGSLNPWEKERRPPSIAAIAAMPVDVLCLQEVWRESDKDAVKAAVKDRFPNVVSFRNDIGTAVDDPTDENGAIPPAPTAAPCADPDVRAKLDKVVDCVKANCATTPGSEDATTTSTDCAEAECVGPASDLVLGSNADKKCYGCFAPMLTTSTFASIRTQCGTDKRGGLAFDGQNGVMVLSRFPIEASEVRVLPAVWNRRVIVRSRVRLPNAKAVDVYCTHLTPVFQGLAYPYTGEYGGGSTETQGWEREQLLQVKKLIALVTAKSEGTPAIILGDLNASPPIDGSPGYGAATLELLGKTYTPGVAASYEPHCTYCKANPVSNGLENTWLDHIYMKGIDAAKVKSTERVHTEATVPIAGDGGPGPAMVPLSDHYGIRSVITIDP